MPRIMMTGMCSVQDRQAFHADERRVFYRPFAEPVRSYADYIAQFRMAANTGNYLITEGAYRAFAGHEVTYVPFWFLKARLADPDFVAYIRREFHFCLFATANILNADFDLTNEVAVLETYDLPTVFMSIGVQRRSDLTGSLHPSARRFVDYLKRDTSFAFTRGAFAADFLRGQGVGNVFEACCPSVFNQSDNILAGLKRLKAFAFDDVGEIWLNGYLGSQARADDDLRQFAPLTRRLGYVFQDEPLLFGAAGNLEGQERIYDETTGRLTMPPACRVDMEAADRTDYYAFFSPEHWRVRGSAVDLFIGRRFHGNLVGLQSGRPAVFVAHDDRVTEMLQAVGLPFLPAAEWDTASDKPALVTRFAHGLDVSRIEDVYETKREQFGRMVKAVTAAAIDPKKP